MVVRDGHGRRGRSVRALAAGLCAAAVLLLLGPVGGLEGDGLSNVGGILTLAALFTLTEVVTVEVHFRHEAHSFTFSEVPLVLGLHQLGGPGLVLAQLLGSTVARSAWRCSTPASP